MRCKIFRNETGDKSHLIRHGVEKGRLAKRIDKRATSMKDAGCGNLGAEMDDSVVEYIIIYARALFYPGIKKKKILALLS